MSDILKNKQMMPVIEKARYVKGNKLIMRNVDIDDAVFIYSLRVNPRKNAFLSPVDSGLQKQVDWIKAYSSSRGQAYFIICDRDLNRLGTVRLYDAVGSSFSWGSWIIREDAPVNAAIESVLMVYRYALDHLGFTLAHSKVDQNNKSVWAFHERFGARRVRESGGEYFYEIGTQEMHSSLARYKKYLPDGIQVSTFA